MTKAKMKIDGMHCQSCAIDIKETLEERAGVQQAEVDYNGKTAFVEFDENTVQPNTLVKVVQDIGYQASISNE